MKPSRWKIGYAIYSLKEGVLMFLTYKHVNTYFYSNKAIEHTSLNAVQKHTCASN